MGVFVLKLPLAEIINLVRFESSQAYGAPELNMMARREYLIEEDFDHKAHGLQEGHDFDLVTSISTLTIEPRVESGYWVLESVIEESLGAVRRIDEYLMTPSVLSFEEFEKIFHQQAHNVITIRLITQTQSAKKNFDYWLADLRARMREEELSRQEALSLKQKQTAAMPGWLAEFPILIGSAMILGAGVLVWSLNYAETGAPTENISPSVVSASNVAHGDKRQSQLLAQALLALQHAQDINPRSETKSIIEVVSALQAQPDLSPRDDRDPLLGLIKDAKQWVSPTGDYANTRHSALKQITTENAGKLQLAWQFSTGVLRGHEGAPLVVGDVMYLHTPFPNIVYALDLKDPDHKILWKYEPKQDPSVVPVMCCDTVNRGLAYGDGKIILAQADTTLVALDAKTGKQVWSVKNGDPAKGQTSTAAPHVFKDKVLVGIAGGEFGVRGHITAYNLADGKQVWRGYSMGPDADTLMDAEKTTHLGKPVGKDSGISTWQGDQWQTGGGTTWGWYSYDPELNLIYYGSGNPSTWNPKQRPGDNRWSMTVWARDLDTGKAKWVYQMTPHDEWDYDGINEMILADQQIGGSSRKTLVHFDRNGFGYTLDRVSGELLVAEKFDPAVNWATKVDMDKASATYGRPLVVDKYSTEKNGEDVNTQGVCPAALGVKDQQPASYDAATGLFLVPTNHVCMDYEPFRVSYTAGQPYVGATLEMFPAGRDKGETHTGNFIAWDAKTGKIVWSNKEQFSVWGGATSTDGGVTFYGTLEGYLKAVDTKTGKELYKYKTPSGIIGNVTTYETGGKQYVAVLSGVGGWAGIGLAAGLSKSNEGLGAVGNYASLANYTQLGGVLSVFALPNN